MVIYLILFAVIYIFNFFYKTSYICVLGVLSLVFVIAPLLVLYYMNYSYYHTHSFTDVSLISYVDWVRLILILLSGSAGYYLSNHFRNKKGKEQMVKEAGDK